MERSKAVRKKEVPMAYHYLIENQNTIIIKIMYVVASYKKWKK